MRKLHFFQLFLVETQIILHSSLFDGLSRFNTCSLKAYSGKLNTRTGDLIKATAAFFI